MQLTVKQYKIEILNSLTKHELHVLLLLFCAQKGLTAKELSQLIPSKSNDPFVASGAIGKIGRRFADSAGLTSKDIVAYKESTRKIPAYFSLVGEYDPVHGWIMRGNLRTAITRIIEKRMPDEIIRQRTT